jgi:hypothetical protein
MISECPRCGFVSVDGLKVRTTDGIVLTTFTDSIGVKHEPQLAVLESVEPAGSSDV